MSQTGFARGQTLQSLVLRMLTRMAPVMGTLDREEQK